eukprot:COSAG01_NODE_24589_length_773_cov_13.655786_1_plen_82_part_00
MYIRPFGGTLDREMYEVLVGPSLRLSSCHACMARRMRLEIQRDSGHFHQALHLLGQGRRTQPKILSAPAGTALPTDARLPS